MRRPLSRGRLARGGTMVSGPGCVGCGIEAAEPELVRDVAVSLVCAGWLGQDRAFDRRAAHSLRSDGAASRLTHTRAVVAAARLPPRTGVVAASAFRLAPPGPREAG